MLLILACHQNATKPSFDYPLDDRLTLLDAQSLGTHNSYHIQDPDSLSEPSWAYTHRPLDEQADIGVRQFELDLHWVDNEWQVFHVQVADELTICLQLTECLSVLKSWSDAHPAHLPLTILMEIKDEADPISVARLVDALDDTIVSVLSEDRLVLPREVQGSADNLRDAVAAGWPTLGTMRGSFVMVMHIADGWSEELIARDTQTTYIFPDASGDVSQPYAMFHTLNNPVGDAEAIGTALAAGQLVRTMTDSDGLVVVEDREAALSVGASFLSTDHPEPDSAGEKVEMPGGTPSRCNPVTAPPECTSEDLENPEFMAL